MTRSTKSKQRQTVSTSSRQTLRATSLWSGCRMKTRRPRTRPVFTCMIQRKTGSTTATAARARSSAGIQQVTQCAPLADGRPLYAAVPFILFLFSLSLFFLSFLVSFSSSSSLHPVFSFFVSSFQTNKNKNETLKRIRTSKDRAEVSCV